MCGSKRNKNYLIKLVFCNCFHKTDGCSIRRLIIRIYFFSCRIFMRGAKVFAFCKNFIFCIIKFPVSIIDSNKTNKHTQNFFLNYSVFIQWNESRDICIYSFGGVWETKTSVFCVLFYRDCFDCPMFIFVLLQASDNQKWPSFGLNGFAVLKNRFRRMTTSK